MFVLGASVRLLAIVNRSLLPFGVVKSKLSVRFEAVVKLPMAKSPTEPMPPGAITEAPVPACHAAGDQAAAGRVAGQGAAAQGDGAAAGGGAVGSIGGHERAGVDGRAAAVEVRAGQYHCPAPTLVKLPLPLRVPV